jgi:glucose-6-phosphate isomerase
LRLGASGRPLRHVIAIGIGGSDLGPKLVCDALAQPRNHRGDGADVAFVSNVDPEHLTRALAGLDPATTLFIVTSKTFTTGETLANAHAARAWLAHALGAGGALGAHFVAITSNDEAARAFGVASADILPIWDWVGGRYSLWSAVGLPIAIRCGWDTYAELLAGAASIDRHFRETPLERNLPVLLALVDFWNARVLGFPQRIVAPYAEALKLLPSYLQQLTLESNGRSRYRRSARLLPVAAPGHVDGSRRVHRPGARSPPARRAAGAAGRECAGTGAGPDARQVARRGARRSCARGEGRRAGHGRRARRQSRLSR